MLEMKTVDLEGTYAINYRIKMALANDLVSADGIEVFRREVAPMLPHLVEKLASGGEIDVNDVVYFHGQTIVHHLQSRAPMSELEFYGIFPTKSIESNEATVPPHYTGRVNALFELQNVEGGISIEIMPQP